MLENKESIANNYDRLIIITKPFLDKVKEDRKKVIEICHVGKFLMLLNNNTNIEKLIESPDFILNNNGELAGLEHEILVDSNFKEQEGHIDTLMSCVEKEIQNEAQLPNFLANCHMNPNFKYKLHQKKEIIRDMTNILTMRVKYGLYIENEYFESISIQQPHSQISICVPQSWWQVYITPELITDSIKKKEKKLRRYKQNSKIKKQWLLIVIGSLGQSSYVVDDRNQIDIKVETEFDKVFLLEDFYNRLYEIK